MTWQLLSLHVNGSIFMTILTTDEDHVMHSRALEIRPKSRSWVSTVQTELSCFASYSRRLQLKLVSGSWGRIALSNRIKRIKSKHKTEQCRAGFAAQCSSEFKMLMALGVEDISKIFLLSKCITWCFPEFKAFNWAHVGCKQFFRMFVILVFVVYCL